MKKTQYRKKEMILDSLKESLQCWWKPFISHLSLSSPVDLKFTNVSFILARYEVGRRIVWVNLTRMKERANELGIPFFSFAQLVLLHEAGHIVDPDLETRMEQQDKLLEHMYRAEDKEQVIEVWNQFAALVRILEGFAWCQVEKWVKGQPEEECFPLAKERALATYEAYLERKKQEMLLPFQPSLEVDYSEVFM